MIFPNKLVISLEPYYADWLTSIPELCNDQQARDEIVRQLFDNINLGFNSFTSVLAQLPKWQYLVNGEKYLALQDARYRFTENTMKFGIGIYFLLQENKLFINGDFPYLLEHVSNDICLLQITERPSHASSV